MTISILDLDGNGGMEEEDFSPPPPEDFSPPPPEMAFEDSNDSLATSSATPPPSLSPPSYSSLGNCSEEENESEQIYDQFPKSVEARGKGGRSFPLDEGAVSAALQVESSSTTETGKSVTLAHDKDFIKELDLNGEFPQDLDSNEGFDREIEKLLDTFPIPPTTDVTQMLSNAKRDGGTKNRVRAGEIVPSSSSNYRKSDPLQICLNRFCCVSNVNLLDMDKDIKAVRDYALSKTPAQILGRLNATLDALDNEHINEQSASLLGKVGFFQKFDFPRVRISKCLVDFGKTNEPLEIGAVEQDQIVVRNIGTRTAEIQLFHLRFGDTKGKQFELKYETKPFSVKKGRERVIDISLKVTGGQVVLKELLTVEVKLRRSARQTRQKNFPCRLFVAIRAEGENAVFGTSPAMCKTARWNGETVPLVLETLKSVLIENGGLMEQGIFRKAASATEMRKWKNHLNLTGGYIKGEDFMSVMCAAQLLKVWFRELPDPILAPPHVTGNALVDFSAKPTREAAEKMISRLPPASALLLRWIVDLLCQVIARAAENLMDSKNCAIVMGPNLFNDMTLRKPNSANSAPADPMKAVMQSKGAVSLLSIALDKEMESRKYNDL